MARAWLCACAALLLGDAVRAQGAGDVEVLRMRLEYDHTYEIQVNSSIEYILEFVQMHAELAGVPARVMLASDTAQSQHPVIVSARQNNGAVMWQLPELQATGAGAVRYSRIERTLCPHNNLYRDYNSTAQCDAGLGAHTWLHAASTCAETVRVSVRVEAARDFYLRLGAEMRAQVAPAAPHYYFYSWETSALAARGTDAATLRARWLRGCGRERELSAAERALLRQYTQDAETALLPPRVRLHIQSEDDVCAVVSIQNYSCPVFDNEREILYEGLYLTMLRSGSIQIERSAYPEGFYVVVIVRHDDIECTGGVEVSGDVAAVSSDILQSVLPDSLLALLGLNSAEVGQPRTTQRRKELSFSIEPSIAYSRYLMATGLAVLFYVTFYMLFVAWVLLLRTRVGRHLVPRARRAPLHTPPHDAPAICYIVPAEERDGIGPAAARGPHSALSAVSLGRRDSEATLDDSSGSEEEERPRAVSAHNNMFGLPPRLRLAALARHRGRVLRARSNRYLWTVITVAVFYSLPVMQLVATYQHILNNQGDQDLCYYNFLCAHPLGLVSDFNHVVSNAGYALLGLLFVLQVARRQHRQRTRLDDEEYGIPQHYGILYALGVALVVEAVLSGSYHICPNQMNFQFDMAFMYVMAVLCMVKMYQSRHPDVNARAHATFGALAVLIALCLWGVLSNSSTFWSVFTVLHLATVLVLSLQIYYLGRFRLKSQTVVRAARELASAPARAVRPLYTARLVALLLANVANWLLAGYGLWTESADFASHLLYVLLGNTLLYVFFYLTMKLLHGERVLWHAWFFIAGAAATWVPAMYYFTNGSTNWATTPALSRHYNKPCAVLEFFDSHDIWHFLSAIAMFMSFNMLLVWDDGLSAVPRREIDVF